MKDLRRKVKRKKQGQDENEREERKTTNRIEAKMKALRRMEKNKDQGGNLSIERPGKKTKI